MLPATVAAIGVGGCARPPGDIHSADPARRVRAIRTAADRQDWQAVPLIVDRLEDEDEAVRFYAILALDRITGERLGYDYARPAAERARAVESWREFVRRGDHVRDHSPGVAADADEGRAPPAEEGRATLRPRPQALFENYRHGQAQPG